MKFKERIESNHFHDLAKESPIENMISSKVDLCDKPTWGDAQESQCLETLASDIVKDVVDKLLQTMGMRKESSF